MRLRFRRSQRTAGMLSKATVFTLEARVDITEEEMSHLQKYHMGKEVIYAKERVAADRSGEATLKGLVRNIAATATALTIRVDDLVRGTKVECKDIMEMMAVEEQIVTACQNFRNVLASMAYFDGEEVIELS
jgi:hypothetical protein